MAHLLHPETEKCTVGIHCQVCNVGQAGRLNALSEMFSLSLASPAKRGKTQVKNSFYLHIYQFVIIYGPYKTPLSKWIYQNNRR